MNARAIFLATTFLASAGALAAAEQDKRLFEMRTYYAPPGRLDDLLARFRDHTLKLFEKHGITNIGYWTPIENQENKLIYMLAFPDAEAKAASWKAFFADPEWKEVRAESEADGRLVTKVESVLLNATDYSPPIKPDAEGNRVFELRTYTAAPNNLTHLNARFRDHTIELFKKHGITNIAYWNLAEGQEGSGQILVYMLGHRSVEAAKASFDAFRQDPGWAAARKASEEKAGGPLTVKGGVKSEFLEAADFSPIR